MKAAPAIAIAAIVMTAEARAQEGTILPGLLDLPVVEGAFIPEDCKWPRPPEDASRAGCVAFPMGESQSMQDTYVQLLQERGWAFASGAGNAFWFHRPVAEGDCVERAYLVGWYLAGMDEIRAANRENRTDEIEFGVFLFTVEDAPRCGDRRQAL